MSDFLTGLAIGAGVGATAGIVLTILTLSGLIDARNAIKSREQAEGVNEFEARE